MGLLKPALLKTNNNAEEWHSIIQKLLARCIQTSNSERISFTEKEQWQKVTSKKKKKKKRIKALFDCFNRCTLSLNDYQETIKHLTRERCNCSELIFNLACWPSVNLNVADFVTKKSNHNWEQLILKLKSTVDLGNGWSFYVKLILWTVDLVRLDFRRVDLVKIDLRSWPCIITLEYWSMYMFHWSRYLHLYKEAAVVAFHIPCTIEWECNAYRILLLSNPLSGTMSITKLVNSGNRLKQWQPLPLAIVV